MVTICKLHGRLVHELLGGDVHKHEANFSKGGVSCLLSSYLGVSSPHLGFRRNSKLLITKILSTSIHQEMKFSCSMFLTGHCELVASHSQNMAQQDEGDVTLPT